MKIRFAAVFVLVVFALSATLLADKPLPPIGIDPGVRETPSPAVIATSVFVSPLPAVSPIQQQAIQRTYLPVVAR
jgi:hypothetical protein